ncbi:MAG: DUF58 domain-containing protein [Armatimonadetes bacterium]|nr:DUF58 domain-containing protein [Armatimonadota bacterium]
MGEDRKKRLWSFLRQAVSQLAKTEVTGRRAVDGYLTGHHRSQQRGFSIEPADVRPYYPGDDPRYLDWRVYGRLDRLFVRQFEQESTMRCYLLVDGSASMGYGSGNDTKWEVSSFLSALLAYQTLRQGDAVGLVVFSNRIRSLIPPRRIFSHLRVLIEELVHQIPSGDTSLVRLTEELVAMVPRRSLLVLISDLLDDPDALGKAARFLISRGHDLLVFQVLDPFEVSFPFQVPSVFQDVETKATVPTDPGLVADAYRRRVRQFLQICREKCLSAGADYFPLVAQNGWTEAVTRFLVWRAKRRGTFNLPGW